MFVIITGCASLCVRRNVPLTQLQTASCVCVCVFVDPKVELLN